MVENYFAFAERFGKAQAFSVFNILINSLVNVTASFWFR